uniref:YtxH-like protein n=1 Tax=Siphoviridae sp. ct9lR64 TaxID=2826178 RepID=A0A8S5QY51_9CAUD|nr:MAG TPA: YtxH-like protein [Siphoviridae sp. ct9lR64]
MRTLLDCVHKIFAIILQIIGVGILIGVLIGLLFITIFTPIF